MLLHSVETYRHLGFSLTGAVERVPSAHDAFCSLRSKTATPIAFHCLGRSDTAGEWAGGGVRGGAHGDARLLPGNERSSR